VIGTDLDLFGVDGHVVEVLQAEHVAVIDLGNDPAEEEPQPLQGGA
jgi:hypothetical protein